MKPIVFGLLSIGLSVGAQFVLRRAMAGQSLEGGSGLALRALATNGWLWAGLLLYVLSALAWLKILSQWEVSKAYPLVGAGFAVTAVIGWMLGEQVGVQRAGGVALICAGVYLVART